MNKTTRLIITACVLLSACLTTRSSPTPQLIPLSIGKTLPLDMKSHGVVWQGYANHLVQLSSTTFKLDEKAVLTAMITGKTLCFDNANYKVYGAVFDASGCLLGTATTVIKVNRIWRVAIATETREYTLDFGQSQSYSRATFFAVAISEEQVLTPDQWKNAKQSPADDSLKAMPEE